MLSNRTSSFDKAAPPNRTGRFLLTAVLGIIFTVVAQWAHAIDISDSPIDVTQITAPPIVMFVIDDSGSMDWEIMTHEDNGLFNQNFYIFPDDPGDNAYNKMPLFSLIEDGYMDSTERRLWKSQWYGYNTLYYNPASKYTPWPSNTGSGNLPDADTTKPRSNPMDQRFTITLDDTYYTVTVSGNSQAIRNAHYFIMNDVNGNGLHDTNEPVYLVSIGSSSRLFYILNDTNHNDRVDNGELSPISLNAIPAAIRPTADDKADLQNFANWYSFYRRRSLAAKAAISNTISGLYQMKIGFYSINKSLIIGAQPIKITVESTLVDQTSTLLTSLYSLRSKGSTKLREGLDAVGRYFKGENPDSMGPSPFESQAGGGECQRVYAIAMTDGYWTENDTFSLSTPDPDGDGFRNTLADVARTYYTHDLRTDLGNSLDPSGCDPNRFQHMVTFALSFGVYGTLNPGDYDTCTLLNTTGASPSWPDPYCSDCNEKVDDLWHAAANTKGLFFNASDPATLVTSLNNIFGQIANNENQGSSVAVRNEQYFSSTTMFQCNFNPQNWSGDVRAYAITTENGASEPTISSTPDWSAADRIRLLNWSSRRIITFDGQKGVPFTWTNLTPSQKTSLNDDEDTLRFIRGLALDKFRTRISVLGDIVHSSPLLVGNTLFVGANDGMLHAFDTRTGNEKFAYIPNLVYSNLYALTNKQYQHRYFIDQSPVYSEISVNNQKTTLLTGGLGKGGKGYYCLDITGIETIAESEDSYKNIVKWEFQDPDHLGFSFSEPVIVKTKSKDHPYVVVFGNGYNSKEGYAELFILNALDGTLVKRFNTGKGIDNGLSTPIITDVNNDGVADYVYAGDLKGNIWKWNICGEDIQTWDISYTDTDGNPAPFFKTPSNQPVTTRPDIMRHCCRHGYMVCFGTGKYLGRSDLNQTTRQSIYGIWDYSDDVDKGEYPGEFIPSTLGLSNIPDSGSVSVRLIKQEIIGSDTVENGIVFRSISKYMTDYAVINDSTDPNPNQQIKNYNDLYNPTKTVGWFLDLPLNEVVDQNVHIRNNVLNVLSKTITESPCSSGGSSMLYYLNPCSGGMIVQATSVEVPVILNNPAIITNRHGEDVMIFKKDTKPTMAPNDGVKSGVYFWRELN